MLQGIDISKYQGIVDFKKVKDSGIKFVIIRAGYGQGHIDATFKRNADECTRLGIPFGVYWFCYAINVAEAKREAEYCLEAIKPYKLSYPVCYDLEYDSITKAANKGVNLANKKLISDMTIAFLDKVKAAGYFPMYYTNLDFYNRFFNDEVKKKYDLWAARYTTKQTDIVLKSGLWQYSSKGKVPGIVGNVDMDYALKDYPKIINGEPTPSPTPTPTPTPKKSSYIYKGVDYQYVFDPTYYMNKYPDIKLFIGKKPEKLFNHFVTFGMKEQRQAKEDFNEKVYRENNPDLVKAYGKNYPQYYLHYCLFGRNEKRIHV